MCVTLVIWGLVFRKIFKKCLMFGSERINHRIFSFHRKFSLKTMTGWRFLPPTFGPESLQIEP
jgi:hypothetical protein